MSNLSKRIRFRSRCAIIATVVFSGLLGFGAGSLGGQHYTQGLLLLGLGVAWFIFAITKGSKLTESAIERRYPLTGSEA